MATAEAVTPNGAAAEEARPLNDSTDAAKELIDEPKPTEQTNGDKGHENKKSAENQNEENTSVAPKNEKSRQDEPSKRVQEGQRYNNRARFDKNGNKSQQKKYDRKNIKSDLTSLQESSDPVAIRKQVGSVLGGNHRLPG